MENESRVTSETRRCIIGEDLVPPEDLIIEILRRLPVKSLARFLLVSKLWLTIIRSQDFIRSFPFQSPSIQSQPPRLLFAHKHFDKTRHLKWDFYLSSSSTLSETVEKQSVSCLIRVECEIQNIQYVNGLISLGYGQQQIITNPSTGKSIILPLVESKKKIIKSFFGYDPMDGQYKVLCMSEQVNEHQVFTLGGQSWKMIECNIPHHPQTNGLCINGVVYYDVFTRGTHKMEWCLMRFDVRTEKLDLLTRLNESNVQSLRREHSPSLINYQGRVAIAFETSLQTFDLWVMDQDAEKWSKICFSIYPWSCLRISCTIHHTGEIIFAPYNQRSACGVENYSVVCYDHKRNMLGVRDVSLHLENPILISCLLVPFSNYVESAMLL